jgi:23S rRNA pseudouridine2605 synthase
MVEATGHIPDALIDAFEKGIDIEGVYYKAQSVERLDSRAINVVLVEGKNREIRRVFSHFHLHPFRLRRMRIGPVKLGELPEGESRELKKFEIEALRGSREWGVGSREERADNRKQEKENRDNHSDKEAARVPRSDYDTKTPLPTPHSLNPEGVSHGNCH